jgi:hypothetical protein
MASPLAPAYRKAWQASGKRNYGNSSAHEKSREISITGNIRDYEHRGKAGKARKYAAVKYTI